MSCSGCKKKKRFIEIESQIPKIGKWTMLSVLLIIGLAVYGICSLIDKIL